jgi:uncharacterized membrane protein
MLAFTNGYSEGVWITYMFYSPDVCGGEGGDWQAIGWFHADPGSTVTVYANDLDDVNNRYWCFYAETDDGSIVWNGPYQVYVTDEAFNHCINIGTTESRIVGFRLLDVGDNEDYTVTLVYWNWDVPLHPI